MGSSINPINTPTEFKSRFLPAEPTAPADTFKSKFLPQTDSVTADSTPKPPTVIERPDNLPPEVTYDDEEVERPLGEYLGNLLGLVGELFARPVREVHATLTGTPEEFRERAKQQMEWQDENFAALGNKAREFYNKSISYLTSPSDGPFNMEENVTEVMEGLNKSGPNLSDIARHPIKSLSNFTSGMLELFVEPALTAATGKKIVGDEILDASATEMADAVTGSLALLPSAGVYNKLAGTGVKGFVGSGAIRDKILDRDLLLDRRFEKLGLIGKAVSQEYAAQAAAGLVQEGLTNPEDISFEMLARNVANPILLATSAAFGGMKYITASKKASNAWLENKAVLNKDIMVAMPTAKQNSLNLNSSLSDALVSIDAMSISDDWVSVGVNKIKRDRQAIYVLPRLGKDKADDILKSYGENKDFVKPVMDGLPAAVSPKTKRGPTLYFDNKFDQYIYSSGKSEHQLAKELGLPVNQVQEIITGVVKAVKDATKAMRPDVNITSSGFKFLVIPEVPLPKQPAKLKAIRSAFDDVLMTYRELTPDQIKQFQQTGFMVDETVSYMGKNTRIERITKAGDKVQIRPTGGKIKWVTLDEINRLPGGDKTIWNKRSFTDDIYNEFISFVDANHGKSPFLDLIDRFVNNPRRNLTEAGDRMKFEQFIYAKMADEAQLAPGGLAETSRLNRLVKELENKAVSMKAIIHSKLKANGYAIEELGTGYKIIDIDGNVIGKFTNIEDLNQFALADFQNINMPDLQAKSTMPMVINETVLPRPPKINSFIERIKQSEIGAGWLRPMARRAEDIARKVGDSKLGVEVADSMDRLMNAIDAMTQGTAKNLVHKVGRAVELGKKIPLTIQDEITKAWEQRSFAELRANMTPEQIADADGIFALANSVGGISKVKTALHKARSGEVAVKDIPNPALAEVVVKLDKYIKEGGLSDEKVLRYVDALDAGENITAAEYIASRNWDKQTKELYDIGREFFDEGAGVFGIDNPITGYAPWLQKWQGFREVFEQTSGESSFIHELKRIGITPDELKVTNPVELMYRYLKTGLHYKAPVAGGGTAGELLSQINKNIDLIETLGNTDRIQVSVAPLREWVNNVRGVPNIDAKQANVYKQMAEFVTNRTRTAEGFETAMDFIALTKLGFRPLLAARDLVGSYMLALPYGDDAAKAIFNFSDARLKRIQGASEIGELPQFSSDAMLSRLGRTRLSKATDISMKVSFQPQVYKVVAGNMYFHTLDKSLKVLNESGGDLNKIIAGMGDLLDSNTRGVQDFFLSTAQVDPMAAAKMLARRNAYNIANRFGRLNNPLRWQSKFGRAFGQFGSWSLNALTVFEEVIGSSRTVKSATRKLAKMSAAGLAVYAFSEATDTNLSNWIVNPLSLIPGPGPIMGLDNDVRRGMEMISSFDGNVRAAGFGMLEATTKGLITPIVARDMMRGYKIWEEDADFFKGLLTASGVKFQPEDEF